MDNFELIQQLLKERADLLARIKLISIDGHLEVKTIDGNDFIYARKRVAGKNTSTYVDVFSDLLLQSYQNQLSEKKNIRKQLRDINKHLLKLGYEDHELDSKILLNIDFARTNIKSIIYDQAILEGISTTFPQTEEILDNGTISGMEAEDVQKILNLKRAWELILDKDVLSTPSNYPLLAYIAGIVNDGFYHFGGRIRSVPVLIGGSTYVPPIPIENIVKESIDNIINSNAEPIDKAISLALYCMKTQIFIDGNKRAAILIANHYLVSHGEGILVIRENKVSMFKKLLIEYYEDKDLTTIKEFLKSQCWFPLN